MALYLIWDSTLAEWMIRIPAAGARTTETEILSNWGRLPENFTRGVPRDSPDLWWVLCVGSSLHIRTGCGCSIVRWSPIGLLSFERNRERFGVVLDHQDAAIQEVNTWDRADPVPHFRNGSVTINQGNSTQRLVLGGMGRVGGCQ